MGLQFQMQNNIKCKMIKCKMNVNDKCKLWLKFITKEAGEESGLRTDSGIFMFQDFQV